MKRIGILGGGQLARMMALAGHPLGFSFRVWDPAPDAPASAVAEHVCAPWDDPAALARFLPIAHHGQTMSLQTSMRTWTLAQSARCACSAVTAVIWTIVSTPQPGGMTVAGRFRPSRIGPISSTPPSRLSSW